MKLLKLSLMAIVILLIVPVAVHAERAKLPGPRVSVIIQFGDGEVLYKDVILPESNTTALKATELACENLSLTFKYTWYTGIGGFVTQIGWEHNNWPGAYWHLFVWNNNTPGWKLSSTGASGIEMKQGDIVAWLYTEDKNMGNASFNITSLPGHYTSWVTFRGNTNNTGFTENIINTAEELWRFKGNYTYGFSSTPTIAYGMMFVADAKYLYSLNPGGTLIWKNSLGATYTSAPLIYGDEVIIGTTDGYLRAFNVYNGTLLWEKKVSNNAISSSPTLKIINGWGVVYIGTYESSAPWGRLYAINATNGAELWNITLNSGVYFGTPCVADSQIVVPLAGRYNASSWQFEPPYGLISINATDGTELWNISMNHPVKQSPALENDVIYVPSGETMYAINTNGTIRWNITLNGTVNSPGIDHGIYVGTSNGWIYSLYYNGTVRWKKYIGNNIASPIVVSRSSIVFATNSANSVIYCYNKSGYEIWNYTSNITSWILASPVMFDSQLVVASGSGYIISLGNISAVPLPDSISVENLTVGKRIKVFAETSEQYQAYLYYRTSHNEPFKIVKMNYTATLYDSGYVGYIPPQAEPCTLEYYIVLVDYSGNTGSTEVMSDNVTSDVPELNPLVVLVISAMAIAAFIRKI